MRLAIVIPTLDEAPILAAVIAHAHAHADKVVVADGGSQDGSRAIARSCGARVTTSAPGRGVQLNAGARAALDDTQTDAVLFLHADTRLPAGAGERVRALLGEGAVGGGFHVRFDEQRKLFPLGSRVVNLRTRLTGCPLGDQAQFATRAAFRALNGFREWPILEDLDFARRLKRHGRIALVKAPVETAARRFVQQGVVRTIATNWMIWALYFVGVHPSRLARWYRHVR